MSDSEVKQSAEVVEEQKQKVTPLRCLVGASTSGALAIALYALTRSIAHLYATKPITFTNPIAMNLSMVVRTIVIGLTALATSIFGFVTIGLILLAIQLIIQKFTVKHRS
jgi:hypothetical protein